MNLKIFSFLITAILLCQQIQSGGLASKLEQDSDNKQLISAVERENEDEFKFLLSQKRSNVNVCVNGNGSLLHRLIEKHVTSDCDHIDCFHIRSFRSLIDAGADVNTLAFQAPFLYFFYHWCDIAPLHLAAQHCLPEFVEILLDQNEIEIRGQAFKLVDISEGAGTCFSPLQLAQQANTCVPKQRTIALLEKYEEDHPGQPKYYSSCSSSFPSPFDLS